MANTVLFTSVNLSGLFVRILTERAQRKAFLQARNCIEERLRMEDENEKQVRLISNQQPSIHPQLLFGCTSFSFTCDLFDFHLSSPLHTPSHAHTFVGATLDEPLTQKRSDGDEGRLPETSRTDFSQDLHPAP